MLIAALSVLVAACSDDPVRDLPTGPTAGPTAPGVSSVEIEGPGQLAPGQSAQFTVMVRLSDSAIAVPASVRWIASPPDFVQIDANGLATGGPRSGGAAVTADVTLADGRLLSKSKSVINLPAGTLFVVGTVTDATLASAPVAGALVEVTPGALSTTTDSSGFYRLYGVPPTAEFRVTANGYQPLVQTLERESNGRQDFTLTLSGPRLNLSGPYTLAIDVTDGCPGSIPLPADLQHRRYDAFLTQIGIMVNVALTEPRFKLTDGKGNRFSGRVSGSDVSFTLGYYDPGDWGLAPSYPDLAERLSNGTFLVLGGTAATTGSAAGLSGTLEGGLSNFDSRFPEGAFGLGSCGGRLRFTLSPR